MNAVTMANKATGLTSDYLNTINDKLVIVRCGFTAEKYQKELIKPLPTYEEYCRTQHDNKGLLAQVKKPYVDAFNKVVQFYNNESVELKKDEKTLQSYYDQLEDIIYNPESELHVLASITQQ